MDPVITSLKILIQGRTSGEFDVQELLNALTQASCQLEYDWNVLRNQDLRNHDVLSIGKLRELLYILNDLITYLQSLENFLTNDFLLITKSIGGLFKLFHEYGYFSVCSNFGYDLNKLTEQLLRLWECIQCFKATLSTDRGDSIMAFQEILNIISQLFGFILLGNLQSIHDCVLRRIGQSLVNEITSRNVKANRNIIESYQIYLTLSHLVFLYPLHDHLVIQKVIKCADNIFSQDILKSFQDTFLSALKYIKQPIMMTNDSTEAQLYRLTVRALLNGLSQLMLRRLQKSRPTDTLDHVQTLWSHVILLSRPNNNNSYLKQLDQMSNKSTYYGLRTSVVVSDTDSRQSTSSPYDSSFSSSSDCEIFSPSQTISSNETSYTPTTDTDLVNTDAMRVKPPTTPDNPLNSSLVTTQNIAECLLHGSSSGSRRLRQYPFVTSSTTLPPLLVTKSTGQFQRSNKHTSKKPSLVTSGKQSSSHFSQYRRQNKYCALVVFCLKHILETSRSQVIINCWPILMSGDCFQTISITPTVSTPNTATAAVSYQQTEEQSFNAYTPHGILTPDLLNLFYKTNDTRIRQMFLEILTYLLSHMNKRFAIAEDLSPHSASFVPYSVKLAMELRQLHRRLLLAISVEKSFTIQTSLLKALNALVLVTPYQRLQPGLLTTLLPVISHLLQPVKLSTSKSFDSRAGCLCLLGNILGKVHGPLIEVFQMLSPTFNMSKDNSVVVCDNSVKSANSKSSLSPTHNLSVYSNVNDTFTPCWLVQVCLRLIHPDVSTTAWDSTLNETHQSSTDNIVKSSEYENCHPVHVRTQALLTLRQFIPNYACFFQPSLPLIKKTLILCLQEKSETSLLRMCSLKFLSAMLPYLNSNCCYDRNPLSLKEEVNANTSITISDMSINSLDKQMTNIHLTEGEENQINTVDSTFLTKTTTTSRTPCSPKHNHHHQQQHHLYNSFKLYVDETLIISWWHTFLPFILHILKNSEESTDRSWCCRILTFIDDRLFQSFTNSKNKSTWLDVNKISESLWLALEVHDEGLNSSALHAMGTHVLHRPFRCNLSFVLRLLRKSQELWSTCRSDIIGLESARCIANCLAALVKMTEEGSPNVSSQGDVSSFLTNKNSFDWKKLIRTCCELCSIPDNASKFNLAPKRFESEKPKNTTSRPGLVITEDDANHVDGSDSYLLESVIKNPNDCRCENGAKALGYMLRILTPGMLKRQETVNELVKTLCQALIVNKINGAAKIRWNANFSAGHLFHNKILWTSLIEKHLTATVQKEVGQLVGESSLLPTFPQLDPITSSETVRQFVQIVKYLCNTMRNDKYFKARVYAARSLYAIFERSPFDHPNSVINLFTKTVTEEQSTSNSHFTMDNLPVTWILQASIHILTNTQSSLHEAHKHSADLDKGISTRYSNSSCIAIMRLTENHYRNQSVIFSTILLFQSLYYLLLLLRDASVPNPDNRRFNAQTLINQMEDFLDKTDLNNQLLNEQINNLVELSLQPTDEYLRCTEAMFPGPLSTEDMNKTCINGDPQSNNIGELVQQVFNLFNECASTHSVKMESFEMFLLRCLPATHYSTDIPQLKVLNDENDVKIRKSDAEISGFRQIYD
ncbi:unnamed protein product [Heterobilharzia americana]|nr:unnamed protein product [Heterobilharzia americana]